MEKTTKFLAFFLILAMLFSVVGCGDGENKTKVEKVIASVMKEVNGRQVVYHNGKPFLYSAMHFRLDQISNSVIDADKALVDGMRLIKENGFEAVIIYVSWTRIYDGEKYDLTWFTKQFKEAEKNNLKVIINWFGSNICGYGGYMPWQTDYNKYPSLMMADGRPAVGTGYAEGERIPDFSAEIFAKEESEAITKICDWLYENDKDRRTVAIQICDEPNNSEGGYGQWMSQFKAYANYMDKLSAAVKNSKYSMVTNTVLMGEGYNETIEGLNFEERIKYLIDLPNLDFVGYSIYETYNTPKFKEIEQDGNFPVLIGLGSAAWCAPAQSLYCLQNAYGYCYYQFINYNEGDWGYYSVKGDMEGDTIYGVRDGTFVMDTGNFSGELEVDHKEMRNMNASIYKLDELIAINKEKMMAVFNNKAKNDFDGKKTIDGEKVYMTYKNTDKKYGPAGFMLKADDGNFYGFATLDSTFTFTSDITVTEGYYDGDKWVAESEVEVKDKSFTAVSGKAYQIIIK